MLIPCLNLDTGRRLYFNARTPLEAMNKLLYTLNTQRYDREARVLLAGGGRTLYLEHKGQTWSCLNIQNKRESL